MGAYIMPSKHHPTETVSKIESQDERWSDDNFLSDEDYLYALIDAINHNFVLEVEASHAQDE